MSFTFTGLLVKFAGGSFAGKKASLIREPNPPKLVPQETARRLFTGPFGTGRELKKSLKLSKTPAPNAVLVKGASARSLSLTGRSVRNCLRFDQKLSGMSRAGAPNLGTADAGTGMAGRSPEADTPGFVTSGGTRLTIRPGTIFPLIRRSFSALGVLNRYDSTRPGKVARPQPLTPTPNHCNIRNSTAFRSFWLHTGIKVRQPKDGF